MKILLIDSNYPINTRNAKICDFLRNNNYEVVIATWLREENGQDGDELIYKHIFKCQSKLGNRFKKLSKLYKYFKFLKNVNDIEQADIIICSHYDMLFLGRLIKNKNQLLVYENLDIPTHSNQFILKALQSIEKFSLKKCDLISFASRFYYDLYPTFSGEKVIVENIPFFSECLNIERKVGNNIVISFIGGVRYISILKKLIEVSSYYNKIEIRIHGEGHESYLLSEYLEQNNYTHVKVTGRYNYSQIEDFYRESDYIWAVYPNDNFNVKYAISNKFHESIFFNRPAIYASGTRLGDYVKKNNIGLVVDYNEEKSLHSLFESIINDSGLYSELNNSIKGYKNSNCISWDSSMNNFIDKLIYLKS